MKKWGTVLGSFGEKIAPVSKFVSGDLGFNLKDLEGRMVSADDLGNRFRHTLVGDALIDIDPVDFPPVKLDPKYFRRDLAPVKEPFLWVKVEWQDDEGSVSYYSTLDRANGRRQLYGEVLSVGPLTRAFADDGRLQRTVTQITFRDTDRQFSDRYSEADWLRARFTFRIGFRTVPEEHYWPISQVMRVDEIVGSTEDTVTLQLIDAIEDIAGQPINLPKLEDLWTLGPSRATRERITHIPDTRDWGRKTFDSWFRNGERIIETDRDKTIPIAFNGAMVRSPFAVVNNAARSTGGGQMHNPEAVIVLGASRRPNWCSPHWWAGGPSKDQSLGTTVSHESLPKDVEVWYLDEGAEELKPFVRQGDPSALKIHWPPQAVRAYVDVHRVWDPNNEDENFTNSSGLGVRNNRQYWYIAALYIATDPFNMRHAPKWYVTEVNRKLADFKKAADRGDVWVRWNRGADGAHPDIAKTGPAGVIKELLESYTLVPMSNIRGLDDAETARDLADKYPVGALLEERPAIEVVEEIAGNFNITLGYDIDARLMIRPDGLTTEDISTRIPNANIYGEDEILEGTFKQWVPVGDQPGGISTTFRFSGVKDHVTELHPDAEKVVYKNAQASKLLKGRQLEREINIAWQEQPVNGGLTWRELGTYSSPHTRVREFASFSLPLHAAMERIGNYIRVTHSRAIKREGGVGWVERLCRVHSVSIDPQTWRVDLVVEDRHDLDTQLLKPYILDDEDNWTFEKGGGSKLIVTTAGSATINLNYIVPGNPYKGRVPLPDMFFEFSDFSMEGVFVARIVSVDEVAKTALLDRPVPVSRILRDWEIQFSYEEPLDEEWGGELYYGKPHNSSRNVGCLCDEDLFAHNDYGAFANGDAGYNLEDD